MITNKCEICGMFKGFKTHYCFKPNLGKKRDNGLRRICPTCNKEFSFFPSSKKKYCNQNCYNKDKIGKCWLTERGRLNIIKNMSGDLNPTKRPEVRKKLSEKAKLRVFSEERKKQYSIKLKGKNNPNYIDGRSSINYSKLFERKRPLIFNRDNWICQLCGDKFEQKKRDRYSQNFLTVHHIDYNKENNEDNNLISLCSYCNSSVNKSREQWIEFFKNKIQEVSRCQI